MYSTQKTTIWLLYWLNLFESWTRDNCISCSIFWHPKSEECQNQTKPIKNTPQIRRLHYLAFDSKSWASGKVHNFPIFNHISILSGIEISFDIFMSNLLALNVAFMRMISYLIESMKKNGVKQAFDLILRLWCYRKVANNREDHSMSIIIWCVNPAANTLYQLSIPKLVSWKKERRVQQLDVQYDLE